MTLQGTSAEIDAGGSAIMVLKGRKTGGKTWAAQMKLWNSRAQLKL